MAMGKLTAKEKQLPREEKLAKIGEYAKEMLRNCTAWERLKARKHPPKACVYLESKSRDLVVLWLGGLLSLQTCTSLTMGASSSWRALQQS